MPVTDPVADMLTRIRNALVVKRISLTSRFQNEGFYC